MVISGANLFNHVCTVFLLPVVLLALILQVFLDPLPGVLGGGVEGGWMLLHARESSKLWLGGGGGCEFLSLTTVDISSWIILFYGGLSRALWDVWQQPGLYPLGASNIPPLQL